MTAVAFLLGALLAGAATVWWLRGDGAVELGDGAAYPSGSVVYRSTDGFFVVRTPDGTALALSDIDPHNPAGRSSCRVTYRPDLPAATAAGGSGRTEAGRFFDLCTGATYSLDGRGVSGDGLDLRRLRIEQRADGSLRAWPVARQAR